jgi:aminodeoxyfutalosine deaminase
MVPRLNENERADVQAIKNRPKPLLHVHLEGSIPERVLAALAARNRVTLPHGGRSKLIAAACKSRDWSSFRALFSAICQCLRKPVDFTEAMLSLRYSLAKHGIDYVEVHCSPWKHMQRGIALDVLGDALMKAIEHQEGLLPQTKIIIDLTRNRLEPADAIASWLFEAPRAVFVGLGISGGPDAVPRAKFAGICRAAERHGFGIVAHAGELEGADSVEDAVRHLHANRITHGVRVLDNTCLAVQLARGGVHLEICPTANRLLGVGHPDGLHLRRLLEVGFAFSINTDDEFIFNTSLTQEIAWLLNRRLLNHDEILASFSHARRAAFSSYPVQTPILRP